MPFLPVYQQVTFGLFTNQSFLLNIMYQSIKLNGAICLFICLSPRKDTDYRNSISSFKPNNPDVQMCIYCYKLYMDTIVMSLWNSDIIKHILMSNCCFFHGN